jgi:hypothetical protein
MFKSELHRRLDLLLHNGTLSRRLVTIVPIATEKSNVSQIS